MLLPKDTTDTIFTKGQRNTIEYFLLYHHCVKKYIMFQLDSVFGKDILWSGSVQSLFEKNDFK